MTLLELLKTIETDVISDLVDAGTTGPAVAKFDNRPTWDNAGPKFDNRPTWDNWNKK
ncbi:MULTISPECIES: multiple cyclophane-containing RiPP AmcA [Streptomycetaceae]|uniref:multiple cyclophane-containing RiPP AmcA n=1 Tax=Streptomycetaceae TaxID=2062 RepID=UPI000AC81159|nr:multiple cyclophane-containing RiPP AmcA [Streptomyces sp. CB02056]